MDFPVSRGRAAWWVVAAGVAAVVSWVLFEYVGTVVLGLFLYYVTRPAYRRLNKFRWLRPSIAATTALLLLAVPIVLLVAYTFAIAGQELGRLQRTVDLGPVADRIDPYLDISAVVQDPEMLLQNPDLVSAGQVVAQGTLDYVPLVGTFLVNLFLSLALAFYLLRDGPRLSQWFRDTFGNGQSVLARYTRAVDEDLGSVFFGNILNALLIVVVAVVVYTVLNLFAPNEGIPYPALIGVLAGAASLVPVVGMKLVYVPVALGLFGRAVLRGDPLWFPIAFTVATIVLIDFIPDLLLRPYVSGRNLHVGLVMIAYIIGPLLFGWYGLFLGPLLLVLIFHFAKIVVPELVDRPRTRPVGVPPEPPAKEGGDDPNDADSTDADAA
ncbi:AI-2E family transporter [Haloarcula marina]|uniref:AI-2E family transporter n=1 Tax=Haloarcula marina TaxID=2961574 RepID=UPI0020B84138|nr:AI-2E family transporter [Halomicroarcula marina]